MHMQDLYLCDYHGLWHERLALDLDQHLRRPLAALRSVRTGLILIRSITSVGLFRLGALTPRIESQSC